MEVLILGVYFENFFFRITWSKIRVRIIHSAHYTRVNTVKLVEKLDSFSGLALFKTELLHV